MMNILPPARINPHRQSVNQTFSSPILASKARVTLVGDPRQGTFATTQTRTNRAKSRSHILAWFRELEQKGLVTIEELAHSHRCNQEICEFADLLYEGMSIPATESLQVDRTGHELAAKRIADQLQRDSGKFGPFHRNSWDEYASRVESLDRVFMLAGVARHEKEKQALVAAFVILAP
jgi:hypothetical protein